MELPSACYLPVLFRSVCLKVQFRCGCVVDGLHQYWALSSFRGMVDTVLGNWLISHLQVTGGYHTVRSFCCIYFSVVSDGWHETRTPKSRKFKCYTKMEGTSKQYNRAPCNTM